MTCNKVGTLCKRGVKESSVSGTETPNRSTPGADCWSGYGTVYELVDAHRLEGPCQLLQCLVRECSEDVQELQSGYVAESSAEDEVIINKTDSCDCSALLTSTIDGWPVCSTEIRRCTQGTAVALSK